jgi:hypothetical protein
MAGGKETPRQKMIGMMYLVLTALLALNVSKTILDAFVAIEENIQVANENEYVRGDEKYQALKEVSEDPTQKDVQAKALKYLKTVNEIDKITAQRIKRIDELKIEILIAIGEDVTSVGSAESIIVQAYSEKDPLRPAKMNLMNVNGKDKYDEPMYLMVGQDIKNPTGKGIDLWKNYNAYRKELTELVGGSWVQEAGEKKYFFKAPEINAFKDFKDLNAQIDKAIAAAHVNPEDTEAIKKIYAGLTKKERWTVNDVKGVHWIGKTFDHAPAVAAIASLTSMQKEVLTARADAIALIRGRVGGGEYSFNKIMALAYGPEVVNQGEEFEVQVLMAAYDSDRQPEVTVENGSVNEIKNGKGVIRMTGSGSEMTLKGKVTIKNKSGIPKTEEWSKTVRVMKPQGTVALPEMNRMYIGYDNLVEAVASGYDETVLTAINADLRKKDGKWIVAPHKVRQCSLVVSGKNTTTGKVVRLGTYTYDVSRLPKPSMYWGSAKEDEKANSREPNLFAKYPPEIPLKAQFKIKEWELNIPGLPGAPPKGTGSQLNQAALTALRMARPGTKVSFTFKVIDPTGLEFIKNATFTI